MGIMVMCFPQISMPQIEGENGTSQAGIVKEPVEVVVVGDATFDRSCIFIHAPRYEWRPEVHVISQDKEYCVSVLWP